MAAKSFDPIDLGPITITLSVDAEMSNGSATVSRCDVAADGPPGPQAMAAVMLRHGLTPVPQGVA
jgi:hypothetical protein